MTNTNNNLFVATMTVDQLQQIIREEFTTFLANSSSNYEPTTSERGSQIMGVKQLAKYLNCGVNLAHRMTVENKIPHHRIGNRYHFYSNDIDVAMRTKQ